MKTPELICSDADSFGRISGPERGLVPLDGSYTQGFMEPSMSEQFIQGDIVEQQIVPHPVHADYGASSDGRIFSRRGKEAWHQLRTNLGRYGYLIFVGRKSNGRKFGSSVHRFLWCCFNGLIPGNLQVNHKDGNKLNNTLDNLELVTPQENIRHAHQNGLMPSQKGVRNPAAKLNDELVREVRRLGAEGYSQRKIASLVGVSQVPVGRILRGEGWSHVS